MALVHVVGFADWLEHVRSFFFFFASDSDVEFLHGMLEGMASIEARAYGLLRELGADPLTKVTHRVSVLQPLYCGTRSGGMLHE